MSASLYANAPSQFYQGRINPGLGWYDHVAQEVMGGGGGGGMFQAPQAAPAGGGGGGLGLGNLLNPMMGLMGGGMPGFGNFASNSGIATDILGNNSYSFLPTMSDMPGMTGSTGIDWSGYVYGNGIGGGFTS